MKGKLNLWPKLLLVVVIGMTIGLEPKPTSAYIDKQDTLAEASTKLLLPFIFNSYSDCAQGSLFNGNFEQDDACWRLFTNGFDWKAHDLVGSIDEGFSPYAGYYAARLGGYEGVWDSIEQTVIIPTQGRLTYWWKMGTYETLPHTDWFSVDLLRPDGTKVAHLASHDDQDLEGVWQQDQVDVTAFAGRELVLRFASYNDNHYFSWFDLDEVTLCGQLEVNQSCQSLSGHR